MPKKITVTLSEAKWIKVLDVLADYGSDWRHKHIKAANSLYQDIGEQVI